MTERISRTRALLANVDSLRLKAEELTGLDEKTSNLKNSVRLCDERYVRVTTQISDLQTVEKLVKDKERELEGMRLSRQHAIDKVEGAIKDLKAKVRRLAEYRCDATGASSCPFLTDAREAKEAIPAREAELQSPDRRRETRKRKSSFRSWATFAGNAPPCLPFGKRPSNCFRRRESSRMRCRKPKNGSWP